MKHIIDLKDVWKTYEMGEVEVHALRGASLSIKQGEFFCVVGPSGSGKSTMMNLIGSLDIPTKGKVYLDGQDISKLYESDLAQIRGRKIGYVFQQFNLIPTLDAVGNVTLPMIFQKIPKYKRIARAMSLLDHVGLGHRRTHRPGQLSGGERQRVAIARALANEPEVILADEPTGNLDTKTGKEILQMLVDINKKQKKTVILVTHDPSLVKYADRIAYLKDGKVEKIEVRRK